MNIEINRAVIWLAVGVRKVSIYNLGSSREALHQSGKRYEKAVSNWLESKGLIPDLDSAIEGTFEDRHQNDYKQ
ncbi:MAG: hypothetical protein ACFFD6_07030 [Candidatus Thorarchaeota archaeon]